MQPSKYVWHNGRFIPWANARVHVSAWSLHYSVAVFEGLRSYDGGDGRAYIMRLNDHLVRFARSAHLYHIPLNYTTRELERAVIALLRKNKLRNAYVRPLLYYDSMKELGVRPGAAEPSLTIFAVPLPPEHHEYATNGIMCGISIWRRAPPISLPADAKCSANYATSYLATSEAMREGYDEAILLDQQGFVSEGSTENVFMVKEGRLITPPASASILEGVTRNTIMALAKDEGIEVAQENITPTELFTADEVFFTGTYSEIVPVVEVDGNVIGKGRAGPLSMQLSAAYRRVIHHRERKYAKWLTRV